MHTAKVSESAAVDRTTTVREQSALFPTRLAMARWTSGGDQPHLHGNVSQPVRAAWYAQAQRDFQAWLDRGGFAQHDNEPAHTTPPDNPPAPDGKAHSANCCTE